MSTVKTEQDLCEKAATDIITELRLKPSCWRYVDGQWRFLEGKDQYDQWDSLDLAITVYAVMLTEEEMREHLQSTTYDVFKMARLAEPGTNEWLKEMESDQEFLAHCLMRTIDGIVRTLLKPDAISA